MDYEFELAVDTPAEISTSSTWRPGERLLIGAVDWPVVPRTRLPVSGIVGFRVISDGLIHPTDAYEIGRSVLEWHFPEAVPAELLYRPFGDPLGAAPGEIRVCLRCGGTNGEHAVSCADG
jgi:hypothetical protein